ncbi:m154.4 protein [Murid betaherpesvirus 1]|uniref:M154.4 protein n=1 Tax=Murid herpesvirus 1 (strain K181) TaxID=69156 RepID=A8E1S2_MUHVK|nr:m154.4 protein [Murid betaherpesvirus 1]CAJ1013367.1 m154.4 protein [Murid betaherpesvirus 1]CAJ1013535.1 m154.4 protein [Murid betaherpesvirus 1]CAP08193.1 m154.4 protein [Murine cytomegalovirus (strain K181)]
MRRRDGISSRPASLAHISVTSPASWSRPYLGAPPRECDWRADAGFWSGSILSSRYCLSCLSGHTQISTVPLTIVVISHDFSADRLHHDNLSGHHVFNSMFF